MDDQGLSPFEPVEIDEAQILRQVANRLREERKRLGLTQAQLAKVGGISVATQHAYEAGSYPPNPIYLFAIAKRGINSYYVWSGERGRRWVDEAGDWSLCMPIACAVAERGAAAQKRVPERVQWNLCRLAYSYFSDAGGYDEAAMQRMLDGIYPPDVQARESREK